MADASMTSTTHAEFVPEVWADGVLEAVEFASVVQSRVTREYEGDISKMGDTVHVNRVSNLTTKTKATGIGATIEFEAIAETKQDITIGTHEYAAFLVEDVLQVQANRDLRATYEKKLGYALTRGREIALTNLFQALSAGQQIGTYGVELTAADFLSVWTKFAEAGLLEASEDPGEDFSVFLSPAAYAAALNVEVFINRNYNPSGNAIQRATVGQFYGMKGLMSNLLRAPQAGQHDCAAIHKGCYALCVQKVVPVRSQWIIRNLGDGVVAWNLYGHAELNYPPETPGGGAAVDNRGVLLKTV